MSTGSEIITDVVFEPFDGSAADLIAAARTLDAADSGIGGVWVYDHPTAMVSTGSWSRDPFVLLGALAASTQRLTLGTLVANIYHRHPVRLAAAVNTLQDVSADRVILGIGSGAAPGSPYASEQEAMGVVLEPADRRRERLVETIDDLRTLWADNRLGAATEVVDGRPAPPIIVGASGPGTVRTAAEHADGVNIRVNDRLDELIKIAIRHARRDPFEISVIDAYTPARRRGDGAAELRALGVQRRILAVRAPYVLD